MDDFIIFAWRKGTEQSILVVQMEKGLKVPENLYLCHIGYTSPSFHPHHPMVLITLLLVSNEVSVTYRL